MPRTKPLTEGETKTWYDIQDLAERLGIKSATARMKLRQLNHTKAEGIYRWATDEEFEALVLELTPKHSTQEKKQKSKNRKLKPTEVTEPVEVIEEDTIIEDDE